MMTLRVQRLAQLLFTLLLLSVVPSQSFARTNYADVVERWALLREAPSKLKLRHHWMPILAGFREVARAGDSKFAPKALYMEAKLWEELYSISRRRDDLVQSHRAAMALAERYPSSRLADDALWIAADQAHKVLGPPGRADEILLRLLREHPKGDMAARARAQLAQTAPAARAVTDDTGVVEPNTDRALRRLTAQLAGRVGQDEGTSVSRVRSWKGKASRRIVIELSQPVEYQVKNLGDDRFEVRMESLFDPDEVRAIFETNKVDVTIIHLGSALVLRFSEPRERLKAVETFVLEEPFRLILEVGYHPAKPPAPTVSAQEKQVGVLQQAKKKPVTRPLVVIDPGHGGKDGGAEGHGGLLEKELTLKVALNLERELKKLGIDVLLTRRDDSFVSLEDRTALANQKGASLFVSIHLNAHSSKKASGVETYFLDTTDDKYSLRLAATENKTSQERVSELQLAMVGLSMRLHTEESESLAAHLQRSMVDVAQRYRKGGVRDLGVKSSLFYVLLGARMPAVLMELGFITNPADAELLDQRWYRRKLASSMALTIREALSSTKKKKSLKYQGK